jgi:hypothetical protein
MQILDLVHKRMELRYLQILSTYCITKN